MKSVTASNYSHRVVTDPVVVDVVSAKPSGSTIEPACDAPNYNRFVLKGIHSGTNIILHSSQVFGGTFVELHLCHPTGGQRSRLSE